MTLAPMRYKTFVWPHNPTIYTISLDRVVTEQKIPFGRYRLQSLGLTHRVFRGEGEFVGEGAYEKFRELGSLFYQNTPGTLVHPVWMATQAWFVQLKLEQRPRRDYVRYSFEFWEVLDSGTDTLSVRKAEEQTGQTGGGESGAHWHAVVAGDSLWGIALQFDTTVERLLELNPAIRNPNLIRVGERVRVG